MKLRKSSKPEVATDVAANGATPAKVESKKKKKFSLFKSKKNKAAPKTPDTVAESPEDIDVTGGKNLLAELDLAATDAGTSMEAEGMELILPTPEYAVEEEPEEVKKVEVIEVGAETEAEAEAQPVEEAVNTTNEESYETNETSGTYETNDSELNTTEETGETAEFNETQETDDTLNRTEETAEEEKKEDDMKEDDMDQVSVVDALKKPINSATDAAMKVLASALKCTGMDPGVSCESIGTSLYENSFMGRNQVDLDNMFDEKTGAEFLHDMTNVGFTLVYHKAAEDDEWIGRTVNMIFRPGVCSAEKMDEPVVEWNTLVGGKSNEVETKTLKLLSIDAVTTSGEGLKMEKLPVPAKPPTEEDVNTSMCSISFSAFEEEGLDCFFTVTSSDGEVYLFEALNVDECHRIVAGIRFTAQRLSQILIEGNSSVIMSDFYDDSREPVESKLTQTEVMNKLSNSFLDFLAGQ